MCGECWLENKCICHTGKDDRECLGCDPAAVAAHAHCLKGEDAAQKRGILPLNITQPMQAFRLTQAASFKIVQAFRLIRSRDASVAERRKRRHAPELLLCYQRHPDDRAPNWLNMFQKIGGDLDALPQDIVNHRPPCDQCLSGAWPLRGMCRECWLEKKCICHAGMGECLGCDPSAVAAHAHCMKEEHAAREKGIHPKDVGGKPGQTASFKIEQAFCLIRNRADRLAENRSGHALQRPDYQTNPDGCAPDWLTMFKTAGGDLDALPWHIVGPKFHGMHLPLPDNPSMLDFRNVTKRLQASYDERGHGWPYPRSSTHTEAEMVNCHACGATVQWKRFGIHKTKTLRAFGQRASPCMNAQRPGASAA